MKAKFETLDEFLNALKAIAERANKPFKPQTDPGVDGVREVIHFYLADYVNVQIEVGDPEQDEDNEQWFNVSWSYGKGRRSSARHLTRIALVEIEQALHPDWKSVIREEGEGYIWHVIDARGERKLQISHRGSDRVIDLNEPEAQVFFGLPALGDKDAIFWEDFFEKQVEHLVSSVEWRDNPIKESQRRAVMYLPSHGNIEVYYG